LEGIFYQIPDADGTSNSWSNLLSTLPDDFQQIFENGAPQAFWAPPSFKRVGDFVLLRGLIAKKLNIVVDPNSEAAPLVGRLPLGMRPHFDHDYVTVAHEGSKAHHLTINEEGDVTVNFLASERYVSLDGIAFPVQNTNVQLGSWQFATDNGLNLFLQPQRTGFAACAWQQAAIEATQYNGQAPASYSHNAALKPGVVQLGEWRVGPADTLHFVIS
jgi:hypothetical protein